MQSLVGGPGTLGLMVKALVLIAAVLYSQDAMRAILQIYHTGPAGQVGLGVAFVLAIPVCLGGVFSGFERANVFGFVSGLAGFAFLAKGVLALYAPSYLHLLPF